MKEYNYIVWVGGSVIGEYESLNEAQEYIEDYHCKIEKTQMKVLTQEK